MTDCPIAFSSLFQLLVAVESLSLWGAFSALPNSLKRTTTKKLTQYVENEGTGWEDSEKKEHLDEEIKLSRKKFDSKGRQVRACKIIPSFVIITMLLIYVACPAITTCPATRFLAPWWRPLCIVITLFILGRVIWFFFLWRYFAKFKEWYGNESVQFQTDVSVEEYVLMKKVKMHSCGARE